MGVSLFPTFVMELSHPTALVGVHVMMKWSAIPQSSALRRMVLTLASTI
jgi:hypothetical protein